MTTSGTALNKVPQLWFEDGSIIITAGDKAFRVYKGVLASRSPVLRDMFNVRQSSAPVNAVGISVNAETDSKPLPSAPPAPWAQDGADRIATDGAPQADIRSLGVTGCPVVRLTDKPQEVEWFLSAFIGDSPQYSSNLAALAGILRLATRYEVDFLRGWAVSCLERLLPTDDSIFRLNWRSTGWMDGLFPLIDVAMAVDVPWILPNIFWSLRGATLAEILDHPEWRDLSEELRKAFLLGREAAQAVVISNFALALRLQRVHAATTAHARGSLCVERFRDISVGVLLEDGLRADDDTGVKAFSSYWRSADVCNLCKDVLDSEWRQLVKEALAAVKRHHGLPDDKKLDEMRTRFHQEVRM